jgi:hypothetical protein
MVGKGWEHGPDSPKEQTLVLMPMGLPEALAKEDFLIGVDPEMSFEDLKAILRARRLKDWRRVFVGARGQE